MVVGSRMYQAMQEEAYRLGETHQLGGERLAAEVADLSQSDGTLPHPAAIQRFMEIDPEAGTRVMDRVKQIGREEHRKELLKAVNPFSGLSIGRYVCAFARGFGKAFDMFPGRRF